ncbi:hypothetical protein [Oceanibacterium hippocampi]|uniref:Uncharacterized protein n=1 Tax=Oceanibacterium hippocampi TaxID=745714 RepID=A0A1Y5T6M5_9PROT|nr:hypothetical protein [Oceanibacterium hippocampi]SLN53729.1 hypothetical protein OCH7691_02260 [Oceanibacterium hippocampi]
MIRIAASGLALLAATPILAATPTAAVAGELVVERGVCERLIRHVADADVTYRPGVGVRGRAVAPADLDEPRRLRLPEVVTLAIDIPLRELLADPNPRLADVEVAVGTIVYDLESGRFTFDDQPIGADGEVYLAERCRRHGRRGEPD